jgi:hypothetical protein
LLCLIAGLVSSTHAAEYQGSQDDEDRSSRIWRYEVLALWWWLRLGTRRFCKGRLPTAVSIREWARAAHLHRPPAVENGGSASFHLPPAVDPTAVINSVFFLHGKRLPLTHGRSDLAGHKVIYKDRCGFPPRFTTIREQAPLCC